MTDNIWAKRLQIANRYYEQWENLFLCKKLEKYYEGFHWENVPPNYRPYTINEFYSIIKIKMALYLITRPQFLVTSAPSGDVDYDFEAAARSAQVKEDVLNTIFKRYYRAFNRQIKLAFLDSLFRFGIIEVGYSADWIINPNAEKPYLRSHKKDLAPHEQNRLLKEPKEIPVNERIYIKRIPAKNFRVSTIDGDELSKCNWCGYYEYVHTDDLLYLEGIKNKDKIQEHSVSKSQDVEFTDSNVIKIWHIWDLRAKKRYILLDDGTEIWSQPFSRLPLFDLRWDLRTQGWYPVPPAFQWVSPQDELNEAREQLRAHRRRFVRKFQVLEGAITEEEIDKFEHGPDGTLVKVLRDEAIKPIQNADLGVATRDAFIISSDDLNKVSGTSAEQRGVADRMTATQSRLIDMRSTIREDAELAEVQAWLCDIAREVLNIVSEKFVYGIWADKAPEESFLGTVDISQGSYYVTPEDLKPKYDYTIQIDVTSLSPVKALEEKNKFLEFLSIVNSFPQIALSPTLIREAAYRVGYRNEKVIHDFQQMAILAAIGNMAGALPGSTTAQNIGEKATPNDMALIENQGRML